MFVFVNEMQIIQDNNNNNDVLGKCGKCYKNSPHFSFSWPQAKTLYTCRVGNWKKKKCNCVFLASSQAMYFLLHNKIVYHSNIHAYQLLWIISNQISNSITWWQVRGYRFLLSFLDSYVFGNYFMLAFILLPNFITE